MATIATATAPASPLTEHSSFEERRAFVLGGAQARLDAELARIQSLGIIDGHGNLLIKELPEDMKPGSDRDFGG